MTLREQMARAIHEGLGGNGWAYTDYGMDELNACKDMLLSAADAALNLIANPDDEMVERCADALDSSDKGMNPYPDMARACLKAIGE